MIWNFVVIEKFGTIDKKFKPIFNIIGQIIGFYSRNKVKCEKSHCLKKFFWLLSMIDAGPVVCCGFIVQNRALVNNEL